MDDPIPEANAANTMSSRAPVLWVQGAGVLVGLLGLLVMIGWWLHWTPIIDVRSGLPPMKFNTALGFFLEGSGWVLLTLRRPRLAIACGLAAALIGLATLAEHLLHVPLGLDDLFAVPYVTTASPVPGRMTPWAAMNFTLLAGALVLAALPRRSARMLSMASVLCGIVAVIASLMLLGYLLVRGDASSWGSFARMAVHTSAAFLLLSVVLLIYLWRATRGAVNDPMRWLPIVGSVTSMAVLALAGGYSFVQLQKSVSAYRQGDAVLLSAQSLLSNLVDMQRGLRGYELTGQIEPLETYHRAAERAPQIVARLQQLTTDDPEQQREARALAVEMDTVIQFGDRIIDVRIAQGLDAALKFETGGEGRAVVGRMLADLHAFNERENALLVTHDAAGQAIFRNTERLLFLCCSLAAALLAVAYVVAHRAVGRRRRTEGQLRDVSALQTAILSSANLAIISTRLDGTITSFNAAAERLLGYRANEVIGRATPALWHGAEDFAALRAEVARALGGPASTSRAPAEARAGSGHYEKEWAVRHRHGSAFPVWLSVALMTEADGTPSGYIAVFDDVTERRKREAELRESEERFRLAFENAPIGIGLVSSAGRWLKVNQGLCRMLGYTERELLATDFQSITHPDDLEKDLALVQETLRGERPGYQMEKRYIHRDGHIVYILLHVSLVRDPLGAPLYFVSQIEDISERRAMERLKSEFVSTVSHELRTPLTSIRGSLGLLAGGAFGTLPEKMDSMVRIAHQNSERLVRIINDILDVEKIESGRLELHPVALPVADFLQHALEVNQAYGQKYHVRFMLAPVDARLQLQADADRLMQVMANLLSNAAKFSLAGSEVWVRARRQGARAVIEVEDHGTGIPEMFRDRVFEKFAQAESSQARRFDGTGLGLNITRKLLQAMGGTIGFKTVTGQGSTFHFDLPLAAPSAEATLLPESFAATAIHRLGAVATGPGADPARALPRILHVEDDVDLYRVLRAGLAGRAELVLATSLHVAEQLLREDAFALVLLDLDLPDGNGAASIERVRTAMTRPVPLVVLSASDLPGEARASVAAALVKSRLSEERVIDRILSLLEPCEEALARS